MKKIAILGSTGSIGTQTLEIVRANPELEVVGLAAGSNVELLEAQIREFHPLKACLWEEEAAAHENCRYNGRNCLWHGGTAGNCFYVRK